MAGLSRHNRARSHPPHSPGYGCGQEGFHRCRGPHGAQAGFGLLILVQGDSRREASSRGTRGYDGAHGDCDLRAARAEPCSATSSWSSCDGTSTRAERARTEGDVIGCAGRRRVITTVTEWEEGCLYPAHRALVRISCLVWRPLASLLAGSWGEVDRQAVTSSVILRAASGSVRCAPYPRRGRPWQLTCNECQRTLSGRQFGGPFTYGACPEL